MRFMMLSESRGKPAIIASNPGCRQVPRDGGVKPAPDLPKPHAKRGAQRAKGREEEREEGRGRKAEEKEGRGYLARAIGSVSRVASIEGVVAGLPWACPPSDNAWSSRTSFHSPC